MKYKDLPGRAAHGVSIICGSGCYGTYSADRGDYWQASPADTIPCGECGEPMVLVQKRVKFVRVTTKKAEAANV